VGVLPGAEAVNGIVGLRRAKNALHYAALTTPEAQEIQDMKIMRKHRVEKMALKRIQILATDGQNAALAGSANDSTWARPNFWAFRRQLRQELC
jgi:hypothetical protein